MEKNTTTSAVKKKRLVMELSTPEAVGWAALVIFICGWFFILGIFVGRGLVPVPGENEPVRPHFAKAETPPAETKPPEETPPPAETKPAAGKPAAPATPPAPAAAPTATAAQAEAGKVSPDKAPPASPADTKAPATAKEPPAEAPPAVKTVTAPSADKGSGNKPAEAGGKIFTIQVAAVRDRKAADECYEKLKKNKYAPDTVQTIHSGGVNWYRLRCGQFASHDEAAPVIERLRKDGFSPILVRRDEGAR